VECSRCGGEAVVKRDNAVYCGKCALARDWEEVIHVVQADRLAITTKPGDGGPATRPTGAVAAADKIPAPEPKVEVEATPAAPPADPFA
jgi:hypothetical protein